MDGALLLARIVLAAIFALAAFAKLVASQSDARRTMAAFGASPTLAKPLVRLLPIGELAVAVLLLTGQPWSWVGAAGAGALLLVFSAAILVNLVKGRNPPCNCFGQLRSQPISSATLARNATLLLLAGFVIWAGPNHATNDAVSGLANSAHLSPLALALILGLATAAAIEAMVLWQLIRQHGRLLLRIDQLEQRLTPPAAPVPPGLAVGTTAPAFSLTTPSGTAGGLAGLRRGGLPVVLIFSDPTCQPCHDLLPDVSGWQQRLSGKLRVAIVSRGSEQANRLLADYQLANVLVEAESQVFEDYGVTATPAAVLIRVDGTIGRQLALGHDAIRDLVNFAATEGLGSTEQRGDVRSRALPGRRNYGPATR